MFKEWCFLFWNTFFYSRDIQVFKQKRDDVTNIANDCNDHKIENISKNIGWVSVSSNFLTKTWISLEQKKEFQNRKHHSSNMQKISFTPYSVGTLNFNNDWCERTLKCSALLFGVLLKSFLLSSMIKIK